MVVLVEDEQFKQIGERLGQRLLDIAPAKYLGCKLLYDEFRKFIEVAPLQGNWEWKRSPKLIGSGSS